MTVNELRELLSVYPDDMKVMLYDNEFMRMYNVYLTVESVHSKSETGFVKGFVHTRDYHDAEDIEEMAKKFGETKETLVFKSYD